MEQLAPIVESKAIALFDSGRKIPFIDEHFDLYVRIFSDNLWLTVFPRMDTDQRIFLLENLFIHDKHKLVADLTTRYIKQMYTVIAECCFCPMDVVSTGVLFIIINFKYNSPELYNNLLNLKILYDTKIHILEICRIISKYLGIGINPRHIGQFLDIPTDYLIQINLT